MQSAPASNFGRYQILAEIGRGAMGVVYKAHDPKIDRVVAIKTILLSERQSEEEKRFRERFALEATAAGRLSHPSIVTIYDVGEASENRNPFIVMEYVEGESLEKQLSDLGGQFPAECGLALVRELACALDYAHSQGIVHRDIKPANILLSKDGRTKITDFGVAKLNTAYQTVAGQSLGTPAYMSPEQLNGDVVDGRSDLFSLGVILYTLLTGHRPFQGNSAMTVSFRVVHRDPVPVSAFDSAFPPDVDYVVGRAIAKDPAHRYQTGQAMADDLGDLQEGCAPRSKQSEAQDRNALSKMPSETQVPTTAGKFTALKPTTPVADSALRKVPRSAKWEYAMFAILTLGVAAMGITLFAPTSSRFFPRHPSWVSPSTNSGNRSESGLVSAKTVLHYSDSPAPASDRENKIVADAKPLNSSNSLASISSPESKTAVDAKPRAKLLVVTKSSNPGEVVAVPSSLKKPTATPEPTPGTAQDGSLHIRVEHRFPAAQVLVWVDDKLAYKEALDGAVKRRMGVFKTVEGFKSGSVQLAAGEHRIRVRVQSSNSSYDRTGTIVATIPQEGERELKIDCTSRKQIRLTLE